MDLFSEFRKAVCTVRQIILIYKSSKSDKKKLCNKKCIIIPNYSIHLIYSKCVQNYELIWKLAAHNNCLRIQNHLMYTHEKFVAIFIEGIQEVLIIIYGKNVLVWNHEYHVKQSEKSTRK